MKSPFDKDLRTQDSYSDPELAARMVTARKHALKLAGAKKEKF